MAREALLIDYEYCSGCHACEVACKQEKRLPVGKGGIHLDEIVTELPSGRVRIDYLPFPTGWCDLCHGRTARGEAPACVKHCQARVMYHGTVAQLAEIMEEKPHCVMFTPR